MVSYAALNYEGLRKLLKKFDKRTGYCVSPGVLGELKRCPFFLDTAGGDVDVGRCSAIRSSLLELTTRLS